VMNMAGIDRRIDVRPARGRTASSGENRSDASAAWCRTSSWCRRHRLR
jgi:hypothetical protein